jgi:outer membrane protein
MSRFVISLLLALTVVGGPLGAVAAELKIGIVDTNAVLSNSAEGKRAEEVIKKKAEDLGRPLGSKRQDIGRQLEDFQKQAGLMKEDARKRKAEELQKKMQDFDKQAADADQQLAKFRETTLAPLANKMTSALEALTKEEKLDLILDKATVVAIGNKSLDYTDKLRAKFGR